VFIATDGKPFKIIEIDAKPGPASGEIGPPGVRHRRGGDRPTAGGGRRAHRSAARPPPGGDPREAPGKAPPR